MSIDTEIMSAETVDKHITEQGYVNYIVDIWEGIRSDPATGVSRFIGVWKLEQLVDENEGLSDPDFNAGGSSWRIRPSPTPLAWEQIEQIKKSDRDAEKYKGQQSQMLNGRGYGIDNITYSLYQAFMTAIDVLAVTEDDAEAWAAVDAYRNHQAQMYEK
jgi:hypothetical protein